ncbi:MAG: YolD-like family protein [Lachnospiraceae bacterium]|nr:YolD-like family protein [Lachnospiraceae bacterium]
MADRKIEDYQDIINLPHHVSQKRPHMSMTDRAAQFSPFAALTGYDAAVKETARLTDQRMELNEEEQQKISERLTLLKSHLNESQVVEITYFVPDERKSGGEYCTVTGVVKKLDEFLRTLIMMDGTWIPVEEIVELGGAMFQSIDDSFA